MVLLQVYFNQRLMHLELVLSSFPRAFPIESSHSNAANRYCHSTIFTCHSLNFMEIPVRQVNILHSSLNQFFGFKMQVYCLPPKSYNQSRTSLEMRTPAWNGKSVVARTISASSRVQREQMLSEQLVTSALKLPKEKENTASVKHL